MLIKEIKKGKALLRNFLPSLLKKRRGIKDEELINNLKALGFLDTASKVRLNWLVLIQFPLNPGR